MFSSKKDYSQMKPNEILMDVMEELDAIKRYVANTYQNTDTEIHEIRDTIKRVETQLRETDSQIDRIERFERTINELRNSISSVERMERSLAKIESSISSLERKIR